MQIRWRSACHVVAKILKCSKIFFQGVTTCHDETVSAHAYHSVSRISWTVRNLRVTDGTSWRKLYVILPPKWHDLARHFAGHCGYKIRTGVRLAEGWVATDAVTRCDMTHVTTCLCCHSLLLSRSLPSSLRLTSLSAYISGLSHTSTTADSFQLLHTVQYSCIHKPISRSITFAQQNL